MKTLQKGDKKLLHAWAFYDWANSVYALTIVSAIFPIFYGALFSDTDQKIDFLFFKDKPYDVILVYITAFGYFLVSIISPILSGIADVMGNKKLFLRIFCYLGAFSCIGLYWFSLDNLTTSFIFYIVALVGYWGSLVFYNSYLPDIAYPKQQDAISAKGFSYGYIGSVLLLIFNLAMVLYPDVFGITGDTIGAKKMSAMRISFVSVGIWWFVFSHYTYYYLPSVKTGNSFSKKVVFSGFKELKIVFSSFLENTKLKAYVLAFFIFNMAVQTVMAVATIFGEKEIAWQSQSQKTMGLIISILVIQLVAILGAHLTAKASARFGNIKVLITLNIIWLCICITTYLFVRQPLHFYSIAVFVGLVMGGVQALSRSTYSKFLPKTKDTTSYFSFYDVSEKVSMVIGLVIYGLIGDLTGSMRNSVLCIGILFLIGIILLKRVK